MSHIPQIKYLSTVACKQCGDFLRFYPRPGRTMGRCVSCTEKAQERYRLKKASEIHVKKSTARNDRPTVVGVPMNPTLTRMLVGKWK